MSLLSLTGWSWTDRCQRECRTTGTQRGGRSRRTTRTTRTAGVLRLHHCLFYCCVQLLYLLLANIHLFTGCWRDWWSSRCPWTKCKCCCKPTFSIFLSVFRKSDWSVSFTGYRRCPGSSRAVGPSRHPWAPGNHWSTRTKGTSGTSSHFSLFPLSL